jgi:hypothetical protein
MYAGNTAWEDQADKKGGHLSRMLPTLLGKDQTDKNGRKLSRMLATLFRKEQADKKGGESVAEAGNTAWKGLGSVCV